MTERRRDRLNAVLDLLVQRGSVAVDDLVAELSVSHATVRRDLDSLAAQQLLTRTRGGAVAQAVAYDLPLRYRNQQRENDKLLIAQAASGWVRRDSVICLSGGTTTTAIAALLAVRPDIMEPSPTPNLTVVTNAVNISVQLATRPQIKVVVTGGVLHPRSYELVGNYAEQVLTSITADIAFVGVNGIDALRGPTTNDEREAAVNRLMAARSGRAVVVADSSKIGRTAFAAMGGPKLFPSIITDAGIPAPQQQALEDQGYEVVIAG